MIEKNVIQSPFYQSLEGTFLELTAGLRPAHFIEDKTNYDQKRNGLFTLLTRAQKSSSRAVKCGIQKGLTISYLYRYDRLSIKQQRPSFESSSTRSTLYAKNTKCDRESHKDLKPSICRSYREGIKSTIRGNFKHLENCESGALRNNDPTNEEINFSDLEISLFSVFDSALVFSFLRVSISALTIPDIMSISAVIKAQIGTKQKS
jgi:hypothetical protein